MITEVYVSSSTDKMTPVLIYKTSKITNSRNYSSVVVPKKPNYNKLFPALRYSKISDWEALSAFNCGGTAAMLHTFVFF